jgi:hypothetical protein
MADYSDLNFQYKKLNNEYNLLIHNNTNLYEE